MKQEQNNELVKLMMQWQKIEDASVNNTTNIIKMNSNPLIHVVMEIIRQDSAMHRRVQQLIIDHIEKTPLELSKDEIDELWSMLMEHDVLEKKTITMAKEALKGLKNSSVSYLIEYLLTDEKKHDKLIENLEKIAK